MDIKKRVSYIEDSWKKRYNELNKIFDFKKNLNKIHLDFGCGFGAFVNILSNHFPNTKFYGQDIDMGEIDLGKSIYKNKNLNLICSEVITGKYDSISIIFTLHELVGDMDEILKSLHKSLNENGKIYIYDHRKVSKKIFQKFYQKNMIHQDAPFQEEYDKYNKWLVKEFKTIMEKAGFITKKIKKDGDFYLYYIGEK
ncbi:MAG: class I SAM-dependent methyltransferase [Candidatus Pacearchaeota archaeon]|jgi:ubiquinone/menaquinone biosynthesis C-methylase UbiE